MFVVSVVCCQVEVSVTTYHSYRGVLPTVVRRYVWSTNLVNEEALAHWGAVAPKTNKPVPDTTTGSDDDRLLVNNERKRAWKEAIVT